MVDGVWIPIIAVASAPIIAIGLPLARAYARRMEAQPHAISADVMARLERMEQGIDAIAVEVERISEGQRFTTRLLSERSPDAASPARVPGRDQLPG